MPIQPDALSKALHKVGANRWMRRKFYEWSMLQPISSMFPILNEDGEYLVQNRIMQRFGSFVEGTTTIGMESDIDDIFIELNDVIEEGFEGTHTKNVKTIVLVTDMFTPPGFVKMKVDERGTYWQFIHEKDANGISFLTNVQTDGSKQQIVTLFPFCLGLDPSDLEINGPALTQFNDPESRTEPTDVVIAFRCKTGLSFNQEFFNRKRYFGWPSQSDLEKMKGQGCLLVPKGHSSCDRKHRILQWRISFSFQERQIMLNLNDAQYKCYMLLKLVKKSHIPPVVRLTSYHCKTALFYTIENTASVIWSEGNLLNCFILCLKRLRKWSRNRFCPNYFLPELNLFTGKIDNKGFLQLTRILSNIIKSPTEYLIKIPTDNFGKLVHLYAAKATDDGKIKEALETNAANMWYRLHILIAESLFHIRNAILQKISYKCTDLDEIIQRHFKWLHTIKSLHEKNTVGEYQLDGVNWILPHVSRFLHTSLASHLAIKAFEAKEILREKTLICWLTLNASYHFLMGLDSDAMSSKMKLATILLYTGHLDIETFKSNYCPTVNTQSLCDCKTIARAKRIREKDYASFRKMVKLSPIEILKMSSSEYIEKYVSACTIFLPSESKITFYPLQLEIHRAFGSSVTYLDDFAQIELKMSNSEFDNCAALDSKIYKILLRILLSDNNEERERNIRVLQSSNEQDSLAHRETTMNLSGWFASTEKMNDMSLYWFKQSWDYNIKEQKFKLPGTAVTDKNAAKWHLALLLFRAWAYTATAANCVD